MGSQSDCYKICLLVREAGAVYQWHRLKIGIYALSEGSIENSGLSKIISYIEKINMHSPIIVIIIKGPELFIHFILISSARYRLIIKLLTET